MRPPPSSSPAASARALTLTRECPPPAALSTHRVYDVDGDFLLIEAAAVLPSWVSPQNSENRLLLAGGALHLLPLSLSSPPSSRPPKHERRLTLDDEDDDDEAGAGAADGWLEEWKAVDEVRHGAGKYRHEEIERAVWDRIAWCVPLRLLTDADSLRDAFARLSREAVAFAHATQADPKLCAPSSTRQSPGRAARPPAQDDAVPADADRARARAPAGARPEGGRGVLHARPVSAARASCSSPPLATGCRPAELPSSAQPVSPPRSAWPR